MKNYIVRKAATREAINRAIGAGKCKSAADVEAIAARLGDEVFWPVALPDTKSTEASAFLREMGVPASLLGYGYLKEAINMTAADPSIVRNLTKGLYPAVAEKFQTTPARVERAMRHSIETAWDRGDLEALHKRFGYTVCDFHISIPFLLAALLKRAVNKSRPSGDIALIAASDFSMSSVRAACRASKASPSLIEQIISMSFIFLISSLISARKGGIMNVPAPPGLCCRSAILLLGGGG